MPNLQNNNALFYIPQFTADGDIGGGYSAVPASNGLLSYFPEYTSFGEFISSECTHATAACVEGRA